MSANHVLATQGGNRRLGGVEDRSAGMWSLGWIDPAAIPPPGLFNQQRAGVMVTEHTLLQVDVVFTALRIISNNIIKLGNPRSYTEALSDDNIPYRVWEATQPEVLTETWGSRTMQCTGMDRTVWSMGLLGEAFWYVLARDRLQYPAVLEVLHPAFMEVKANKLTGEPEYIYGTGQDRRTLDPEDVVHIPLKSLPGARRALSPIEYAGVAGALAMAAYEFGSAWFSQGASPSFLLTTEAKLGQAEVERIAEKFMAGHAGLPNSHLPLVLDNGLKAEKVMTSPDEAQYLNTLEYARSVIFSWFGIEFAYSNALQRSTPPAPGSLQEESMRFLQHTLSGYLVPLEETFSRLLPKGKQAAFDEGKLARPNAQALSEEIQALRGSQVGSINDLRTRRLGWAPVPGGDDVLAPLASNTAPGQMAGGGAGSTEDDDEDDDDPSGGK
ncbi:MAG TPA: phage portal protein [Solirubrobacteraceae bacterium]|jgi:HK97 family phage portal protein